MGRKNRPRTEQRVGDPPGKSKYSMKTGGGHSKASNTGAAQGAVGTLVTVVAVPRNKGIVFVRTRAGVEMSINMSVVRRDYKSGVPKIGWIIDCDFKTKPEWKRPRVTRIHSVTPD